MAIKRSVKNEEKTGAADAAQIQEKTRKIAYDLFLKGGMRHGNDLAHWFEAEKRVKAGSKV